MNASKFNDRRWQSKWSMAVAIVRYVCGLPMHSLVFRNAFTNKIEAIAVKPKGMSRKRFDEIVVKCREGKAYDVADDMLAIMAANPKHPNCFLLPN